MSLNSSIVRLKQIEKLKTTNHKNLLLLNSSIVRLKHNYKPAMHITLKSLNLV